MIIAFIVMELSDTEVINAACQVMKNAYCPYSKFPVGCALICLSGKIYTGGCCNFKDYYVKMTFLV